MASPGDFESADDGTNPLKASRLLLFFFSAGFSGLDFDKGVFGKLKEGEVEPHFLSGVEG